MKSLQKIQKIFKVLQIITKIAMIFSFVWAGLASLGMLCGQVWYLGGTVIGASQDLMLSLTVTDGLPEMIGVLFTDAVFAVIDGILLIYALRYFKAEQADGTPFSMRGAELLKHLGILTIVLPLAASILSAIACEIFGVLQSAARDWGNLNSLGFGIALILASLIFRYGAELEEKRALQSAE